MSRTNLLEVHAREKASTSEDWEVYRYECMPPPPMERFYFQLTGAVAPLVKSGSNKGRRNWGRRDKATEKTVAITFRDHDEWLAAWEAKTGKCSACAGDGKEVVSASVKDGTTYRDCRKCKGTGLAQKEATEAAC